MTPATTCNPVLATVVRGGEVESVHRGSAVVADARGDTVLAVGDITRAVFPRSSYKFIQAVPLVESGAADAFGLGSEEIALACASHNAEPVHMERVEKWLERLGLSDDDLECGPVRPGHAASADCLVLEGTPPGRRHNNCSGKHMGMLTLARHLGAPTRGYSEYGHPTQRAWREVMENLTGLDIGLLAWERDGCGLPALCMPMDALARGFARFAVCDGGTTPRSVAMDRVLRAVAGHPELVAGSGRCCTAVIRETHGRVLVKTGAEGMFSGVVPESGLGFVLKVDDGAWRGSEVALGGLLSALGLLDDSEAEALQPWFRPDVVNSQGKVTGRIEAPERWSG